MVKITLLSHKFSHSEHFYFFALIAIKNKKIADSHRVYSFAGAGQRTGA